MKNLFLTFLMLAGFSVFADDLYVNSSGLEGTYYTIQEAVNAASSGDNIYISTVGTFSEDVTIDKTVFLIAGVPDELFTLAGDILISNNTPGIEVTVIGLNNGSVKANNTNSSTKIIVNIISSLVSEIYGNDGFEFNVYDCEVYNNFQISNGQVKGSIVDILSIKEDGSSVYSSDTIKIMGNQLGAINWSNNDEHYFEICNNYLSGSSLSNSSKIYIGYWRTTSGGTNLISNNTINGGSVSDAGIEFYGSTDGQNLVVCNNYIYLAYSASYSNDYAIKGGSISNAFIANNYCDAGVGSQTSNDIYGFTNSSVVDNVFNQNYTMSSTGSLSGGQEAGLDWIEFRDIDNTINDIGTTGGPHAWSNYNTTQGKAAIFDFELPFQLYIGGIHSVKAKAFHKN